MITPNNPFARSLIRGAVLALLLGRAALAFQTPPVASGAGAPALETAHLRLTASAPAAAAAPGSRVLLALDVVPKRKMHVYAPGQDGYIPISITLAASAAYTIAPAKFPTAEKYVMPALNETQLVYSRPFRITQEITLARAAAARTLTIKGTVRYQACDETACYLPKNVPVEWQVKVHR